ncbi:MAG: DNA-directed RNA polymerase subunit H [Halobacteriota archaeon]
MKSTNFLKHEMVPEHVVMSEEEVQDLLARYRIELKQLPKILITDPVCKEIGAKKDDVVKIVRRSLTAEEAVSFRLVIDTKIG